MMFMFLLFLLKAAPASFVLFFSCILKRKLDHEVIPPPSLFIFSLGSLKSYTSNMGDHRLIFNFDGCLPLEDCYGSCWQMILLHFNDLLISVVDEQI